MDNKNQNNTPTPDYGFILNQAPVGGEPKKHDKKVLIIIILLVVLAVVLVLSVVLSARSKVVTTDTPAATTNLTADQAGKQFFTYLQDNKSDDAYKLLSTSFQERQNIETFKGTFVSVMRQNLNLQNCQYNPVNTQANNQIILCPMQNGKASLAFTVSYEAAGQTGVAIKDLAWQPDKPLTTTDIKQNNAVQ